MPLLVAGLSHRTAPLELRERFALAPEEVPAVLDALLDRAGFREGLILSTCNRTEIYGRPRDGADASEARAFLETLRPELEGCFDPDEHLYAKQGNDALGHLFRVAAGLDSMVLGEQEIVRQVRDAYRLACSAGAAGPLLHRAVPRALQIGKRIRTDTAISQGIASVAGAAVSLVDRVFRDPSACSVVAIGAGATIRTALRSLRRGSQGPLVVANRSEDRGRAVAQEFGGVFVPLSDLAPHVAAADVVISATGSREPLVRMSDLGPLLGARGTRPLLILDLGVPRDVEGALADHPGVFLHNVDDLDSIAERGRRARELEVPKAEAIVTLALGEFRRRRRHLDADPAVRDLLDALLALRSDVVQGEPGLSDAERAAVERVTGKLVDRVLRRLAPRVKEQGASALEILEAFGIEPPPPGQ